MTTMKTIAVTDILVPERLRAVEDDHALAIQASIVEHGLLNPITVRATPAAERPYTLVAGAHRLRAVELLDDGEGIDAIVVKGDRDEAILIEIAENLFRNDLSVLDRAVFVQTYRDVWERKYGAIGPGNPEFSNRANLAQLIEDEAAAGFSAHVADRMGVSPRAVKRLNQIAQNLPKSVREAVRGTPIADNQSQLLSLAKLPPDVRRKAGTAVKKTGGDFKAAMAALMPREAPDIDAKLLSKLIDAWERASDDVRAEFRKHIGRA